MKLEDSSIVPVKRPLGKGLRGGGTKQRWARLDGDDGWQIIIPDVDVLPHSTDLNFKKKKEVELAWLGCPCKSEIDAFNKIIIHHSFLDKERIEKAMKVPSIPYPLGQVDRVE